MLSREELFYGGTYLHYLVLVGIIVALGGVSVWLLIRSPADRRDRTMMLTSVICLTGAIAYFVYPYLVRPNTARLVVGGRSRRR